MVATKLPGCLAVYLIASFLTMLPVPAISDDASGDNSGNSTNTTNAETNAEGRSPSTEIIYLVLAAELAANREDSATALNYYLKAAKLSQDPGVAEQATQWAVTFQDPKAAMTAAEIWAKAAPGDLQPQMVAMTLFIGQSIDRAKPYLKRAIDLAPENLDQQMATIQSRLSKNSATNLKLALESIAKENPKNAYAALLAGQSDALEGDIKNANVWIDKALSIKPDLTPAITLKSRILRFADQNDSRALQFLDEKLKAHPNNGELRLFYANALLDANRINDAVLQLKKLIPDKTYGSQALLFLGEIYVAAEKYPEAKSYLTLALKSDRDDDVRTAKYLLGSIDEVQGDQDGALSYYLDIEPGTLHVQAVLRASRLLTQQKDYTRALYVLHDATPRTVEEQKKLLLAEVELLIASRQLKEADELTNDMMEKSPEDPDIIFAHSQVATKMKRFDVAEKDLKSLLKKDPRNAEVLNALGYLLAHQGTRLNEAKVYSTQALQLSPNHPFYLDTAGWIAYRLGNNQEALLFLKKAAGLSSDPEIAAHFGEVLWSTGKKNEALKLWEAALKKAPDNDVLQETLNRLKPKAPLATTQP